MVNDLLFSGFYYDDYDSSNWIICGFRIFFTYSNTTIVATASATGPLKPQLPCFRKQTTN